MPGAEGLGAIERASAEHPFHGRDSQPGWSPLCQWCATDAPEVPPSLGRRGIDSEALAAEIQAARASGRYADLIAGQLSDDLPEGFRLVFDSREMFDEQAFRRERDGHWPIAGPKDARLPRAR